MSRDPVAEQYERWPYPDPSIGVNERFVWNDPAQASAIFWPDRPPPENLRILVAGCGTSEAAALAHANPAAQVVGIDVSAASIGHQAALCQRHGLGNVRLELLPLEEVGQLGLDFDLVSAGGVLHHLADPAAGLKALGEVLRPHGVVTAAIYARHGRVGVYLLQEVFRGLGLGQAPEDVHLVRATLAALPAHHPARAWMQLVGEQSAYPGHVVDTWLHPRDQPMSVDETLQLVDEAGLAFQGWFRNAPYHAEATFGPGHPMLARLAGLSGRALWSVMERIQPTNEHLVMACRRDRPRASWAVDLERDDLVPERRFPPLMPFPPLPFDARDPVQERLYRQIDGARTVAECAAAAGVPRTVARAFFAQLWRKDAVVFRW